MAYVKNIFWTQRPGQDGMYTVHQGEIRDGKLQSDLILRREISKEFLK